MADVLEVKRKHYSGLDADKAGITGVLGDTYAANDSGKAYYWNDSLSAWKTGLGYEFVPRLTNAFDKQVGDFVTDGALKVNGLDLSGIVPAGAVMVKLKLGVQDDAADSWFTIFRDAVNTENHMQSRVFVANIAQTQVEDVAIDTDRLLDYQAKAVAFVAINVTVLGWWI